VSVIDAVLAIAAQSWQLLHALPGTMGKEAAKLLGRLSSPDQAERVAAGLENRKPSLPPTKLTQETVCVLHCLVTKRFDKGLQDLLGWLE